jgi:flagellar biosynthesis component FlhA
MLSLLIALILMLIAIYPGSPTLAAVPSMLAAGVILLTWRPRHAQQPDLAESRAWTECADSRDAREPASSSGHRECRGRRDRRGGDG